eukprot:5225430-Ditylum_brightwellii.AAC.1
MLKPGARWHPSPLKLVMFYYYSYVVVLDPPAQIRPAQKKKCASVNLEFEASRWREAQFQKYCV